MPEENQKEYQPLDTHNREYPPPIPFPKRGDGPDFLGRLRGKRCRVYLHDGDYMDGILLKYNRYEVLFQEDKGDEDEEYPIVLMKNFIAAIVPLDCNPFEKKPEEKPAEKEEHSILVETDGGKLIKMNLR